MNGKLIRAGLVSLGLLAAGAAIAQPGPGYGRGEGPGFGGYGPGMMGGYGGGMMGGGFGRGMMRGGYGGGPLAALNLTGEQEEKIFAIQEENRRRNWDRMGQLRAEQFRLRRLWNSDNVEPKAFAEQQRKVDELRREMMVSRLETRKQIESVLTPEQRRQFRQFGPRWLDEPVE